MKTDKTISKNTKATSVLLSILILFVSCTRNGEYNLNEVNGENLFRAIYFKQGPLVDDIYTNSLEASLDIQRPDNVNLEEVNQIQNLIIETIRDNDPNYFSGFEDKMRSDDMIKIEASILEGAKKILETLLIMKDNIDLRDNEVFQSFLDAYTKDVNNLDEQALLAILYLVAVFAIAVYLAVYAWDSSDNRRKGEINDNRLFKEQLIHNIYLLNQAK